MKIQATRNWAKRRRLVVWQEFTICIYFDGKTGWIDFNKFDYFLRRDLRRSSWQCLVKNLKRRGYKFYRKSKGGQ